MKQLSVIDMVQNQIQNHVLHVLSSDPTPIAGQIWYNSTTQKVKFRNASTAITLISDGADLAAGSVANTALTTNPLARANHTGTQTASTISDLATVVKAYRLDEFAAPNVAWSAGSQRITSVATPTASTDAANKQYVDDAVAGLSWKDEVRVATTANGTLATAFANGQTVDGITLATGDRILIKNQSAPAENGIYTVNGSGAPTRATDSDTSAEILGSALYVSVGTTNATTRWVNTNSGPITVNTTGITWASFGGGGSYTNGNGLSLTGNVFAVVAGNGIIADGTSTRVDPAVVVRKYAVDIGNASSTSIAVTHSLGSKDVTWSLRQNSDDAFVNADAVATSTSVLTFTFTTAPASNALRAVVHV